LNSRETIWQNGLRAFGSNYLVGVGAGAFQSGVGSYFSAHNTFLAVLVEQGLLGFSVFSVILGCALQSTLRAVGEDRKMCVLLLVCWAVGVFTLGWTTNRVTWFVLGLVVSFGRTREHQQLSDPEVAHRVAAFAGGAL
jgi:O-antigen ligase